MRGVEKRDEEKGRRGEVDKREEEVRQEVERRRG